MAQLSTGLIIAGAYADKVRRVLFAQLRDELKKGTLTSQEVAYKSGQLNRLLYEILVNKLKLDKGDVVRIRVEYDVKDGKIEWNLNTLQIEVFRREEQEKVDNAIKEVIEKAGEILAAPPTAEEREWTGGLEVKIASAVELGRTSRGEKLFLLKNESGENIGIASYNAENKELEALVVVRGNAFKASLKMEEEPTSETILKLLSKSVFEKTSKEEAEKAIREKMLEVV